jgi:polyadenylation factor subunit 2
MAHPALLPATAEQGQAARKWQPSKYTQPPQPPPQDEARQREIEMATARQLQDGKALKKIRPRRTVDYGGSMGRWILVSMLRTEYEVTSSDPTEQLRKLRPNATYTPRIHPVIPIIIDVGLNGVLQGKSLT